MLELTLGKRNINLILSDLFTRKGVYAAIAAMYLFFHISPLYFKWQSFPILPYLGLALFAFIPMWMTHVDKNNPQLVDGIVYAAGGSIIMELIINSTSWFQSIGAETVILSSDGMQGWALLLFAGALGIASHKSGSEKSDQRNQSRRDNK